MPITLKIISYQRLTPGQQDSYQSDSDRFTIGRGSENDWSLPDPQRFLSGSHCRIERRGDSWFLTDTSTNGVFVNGADRRLPRDEPREIQDGDRLRMGDYELKVSLQPESGMGTDLDETAPGMQQAPQRPPSYTGLKEANTPLAQMDQSLLGSSISIDDIFRLDEEEESPSKPSLASRDPQGTPLRQHFTPPRAVQPGPDPGHSPYEIDPDSIPEDWDTETGISARPAIPEPRPEEATGPRAEVPEPSRRAVPETPPAAPVAPARAMPPGSTLQAFAAGAGLTADQLTVENETQFFEDVGRLMFALTDGLMQAIASRTQIKSEFRLEQTMIAPAQNNPIKFSANAQEALLRLLNPSDGTYQSGPAAASEAIDDINAHQMGVLAGTEAALRSILQRFSPDTLEAKMGGESFLRKSMSARNKAKCWDFYRVLYGELAGAADDDFQQIFGAEFSNAYEKQLERLKIARKENDK